MTMDLDRQLFIFVYAIIDILYLLGIMYMNVII